MGIQVLNKEAYARIRELLPSLGPNKQRELVRLVFEIAKRDKIKPHLVISSDDAPDFERAKIYLLKKRYPKAYGKVKTADFYLPALETSFLPPADLEAKPYSPKYIYIEKAAQDSPVAKRALALFPQAEVSVVEGKKLYGSANYTARKDTLVIINEKYDFLKPCPCTSKAKRCGYNLVNLGFGCYYDCAYCFLQQYQNAHAVVLPANIKDFLSEIAGGSFNKGIFPYSRIGSGEFTDSLLFDHITNYSTDIIEFFRGRKELFEFKTKSINTDNLLKQKPAENIVVGWSVNPQNIIDTVEFHTPALKQRLAAAAEIAKHGFKTAFHFDPVILHKNWRKNYAAVIEEIENTVPKESIMWFSVGTLRFNRELKKFIETRFPENEILDEEFVLDFDGKMRYEKSRRQEVYTYMTELLKAKFPSAVTYLCMENTDI